MTTISQDIRAALQARALAVAGVPASPNQKFEGRTYTPVVGTPYIALTLIPTSGRSLVANGQETTHRGLFQVGLFFPSGAGDGVGTGAVEIVADAITAAFTPGLPLYQNGEIVKIDYAERQQVLEGVDWLHCPITIGWHCTSTRN